MAKIRDELKSSVNYKVFPLIGDVIGHDSCERQTFTDEINNIIYKRLKEETEIQHFPILGLCVDFGMGDFCLEEAFENGKRVYRVYCIDRAVKFDYQEFELVEDAIVQLANMYAGYEINNPEEMTSIMFEVLKLPKNNIIRKIN